LEDKSNCSKEELDKEKINLLYEIFESRLESEYEWAISKNSLNATLLSVNALILTFILSTFINIEFDLSGVKFYLMVISIFLFCYSFVLYLLALMNINFLSAPNIKKMWEKNYQEKSKIKIKKDVMKGKVKAFKNVNMRVKYIENYMKYGKIGFLFGVILISLTALAVLIENIKSLLLIYVIFIVLLLFLICYIKNKEVKLND